MIDFLIKLVNEWNEYFLDVEDLSMREAPFVFRLSSNKIFYVLFYDHVVFDSDDNEPEIQDYNHYEFTCDDRLKDQELEIKKIIKAEVKDLLFVLNGGFKELVEND